MIENIALVLARLSAKIEARIFGLTVTVSAPLSSDQIDKRIEKIEIAKQNMMDALEAIDQLRFTAQQNKNDLDRINKTIATLNEKKDGIHSEIEALKAIAALDSNSVREALRLPSAAAIWKERIIGFIFGITASVIATIVWEFVLKKIFGVV